MKKTVTVSNKNIFVARMLANYWYRSEDIPTDTAIISIGTPGYSDKHYFNDSSNVLNIDFDDVEVDMRNVKKIYDFIQHNFGKNFIIHCDAGISRSQAVGQFIIDTYGDEYQVSANSYLTRTPNTSLYCGLKQEYYTNLYKSTEL